MWPRLFYYLSFKTTVKDACEKGDGTALRVVFRGVRIGMQGKFMNVCEPIFLI